MARFHFASRPVRAANFPHPAVSRRSLRALRLDDPESEAPVGPGWFMSSWDLVSGLEIHEGLPSDTPLNDWLAWCLKAAAEDQPPPGRPKAAERPHGGQERSDVGAVNSSAAAQRDEQPGARLVPAPAHGALVHVHQLGDLGLAVAAEVAHLDQFSEFGIDGLELV